MSYSQIQGILFCQNGKQKGKRSDLWGGASPHKTFQSTPPRLEWNPQGKRNNLVKAVSGGAEKANSI